MGILDEITEAKLDADELRWFRYQYIVELGKILDGARISCAIVPDPEVTTRQRVFANHRSFFLTGTQLYSSRNSIDEFTRIEIDEEVRLIKSYDRMASFENKSIPLDVTMPPSILAEWIISEMRTVPWRRELAWLRDASAPVTKAFSGCDFTDVARSLLAWDVRENRIIIAPYRIDFLDGIDQEFPTVTMIRDWTRRSYGTGFSYFLSERIPLSPDAEIASDQVSDFVARIQEEWLQ